MIAELTRSVFDSSRHGIIKLSLARREARPSDQEVERIRHGTDVCRHIDRVGDEQQKNQRPDHRGGKFGQTSPAIPCPVIRPMRAEISWIAAISGYVRSIVQWMPKPSEARVSRLSEPDVLKRIKALAIPPAWTDVWICPFVDSHMQATGRDAKGRKQYRYHVRFREVRESTKYEDVVAFADALPGIRKTVQEHFGLRGLPREKVATVVHLLETTPIRVGNDDYARPNNSYGLTTLKNRHVAVDGNEVRFRFTGKSGKQWSLRVKDRRVAKIIIKACQDLPGQELLQYVDEAGNCQDVSSSDVNDYLKEITGKKYHCKGLPHLGGDSPSGDGAQ